MNWLTKELRLRLKVVFEPKYGRKLTESEVEEIAENLVSLAQNAIEIQRKYVYEKCVQN